MRRRLFFSTAIILSVLLMCFFSIFAYSTYANNLRFAESTVIDTTQIFADLYDEKTDLSTFVHAGNSIRVTVISSDGTVLADSRPLDIDAIGNHLDRPEIQAAANDSPAPFVRHSESLGIDLIYYAQKVDSGTESVFIRAAVHVEGFSTYLFQFLPLLILLLIVIIVLSYYFASGTINRFTKPFEMVEQRLRQVSEGDFTSGPMTSSYDEIDQITLKIDDLAQILQETINNLHDEKYKIEYILNNICDGLFVIDEEKCITLINPAALDTFDVTSEIQDKDINYLSSDRALIEAIESCVDSEKNSTFELGLNGRFYSAAIRRLPDAEVAMVVLTDITESRESAKQREEFFANASHELKTPLTAVRGFTELAALNNKDEGITKYISGITRETDRMLTLIGDMLELSELENIQEINPTSVSLALMSTEVQNVLAAAIEEKSVDFTVTGDAYVTAEPVHVYELIKNLAENAVRYNDENGSVSLTIQSTSHSTTLVVADTGIGISPEEQTRVFERFYRTEKSRSQQGGGTGLGLSIVKHICAIYNWDLSLQSKPGVGTEITITFKA